MNIINNHQKLCDVTLCFWQLASAILYEENASVGYASLYFVDYTCLLVGCLAVLVERLSSNFG